MALQREQEEEKQRLIEEEKKKKLEHQRKVCCNYLLVFIRNFHNVMTGLFVPTSLK